MTKIRVLAAGIKRELSGQTHLSSDSSSSPREERGEGNSKIPEMKNRNLLATNLSRERNLLSPCPLLHTLMVERE
jgi:hypothetical protein